MWAKKFGSTFIVPHLTSSNRLSFVSLLRDHHNDVMYTIHCRYSTSFEVKQGNPNPTSFTKPHVQCGWSKLPDVDACPHTIFIYSSVLRRKSTNLLPLVLRLKLRNHHDDFAAQITKSLPLVLRPKPGNPHFSFSPHVQCGSHMASTDLLIVWPPSARDLCLIILDPLHQVSYSCLDTHHCPLCRICYLHITRQSNTFLHTK
jgi:hypothetical protein